MNIEKVIDEYRKGDEGKRLSLFLAYRDLRDFFMRLEQENPNDDLKIIAFPWHKRHRLARAA